MAPDPRQRHAGEWSGFFVQGGSQLDFTVRDTEGLGRIGNARGRVILIHSTLALLLLPGDPLTVLGLAHQLPWVRDGAPHKPRETRTQRARRSGRESDHWFGVFRRLPGTKARWRTGVANALARMALSVSAL